MRAVLQRVTNGKVTVENEVTGEIEKGFVILLGVGQEDTIEDARYLADKTANLRVFEDEKGKMNLSLMDINGQALVISQFTLFGDCRKGRRPSFSQAASAEDAESLYMQFVEILKNYEIKVEQGRFQTHMLVDIHNDGPVTLLLDSKKNF